MPKTASKNVPQNIRPGKLPTRRAHVSGENVQESRTAADGGGAADLFGGDGNPVVDFIQHSGGLFEEVEADVMYRGTLSVSGKDVRCTVRLDAWMEDVQPWRKDIRAAFLVSDERDSVDTFHRMRRLMLSSYRQAPMFVAFITDLLPPGPKHEKIMQDIDKGFDNLSQVVLLPDDPWTRRSASRRRSSRRLSGCWRRTRGCGRTRRVPSRKARARSSDSSVLFETSIEASFRSRMHSHSFESQTNVSKCTCYRQDIFAGFSNKRKHTNNLRIQNDDGS